MQTCTLNGLVIGGNAPIRLMGVINCSPESFYSRSYVAPREIHSAAVRMIEAGADLIDIGARSTAPASGQINETTEMARLDEALGELDGSGITISVDTPNPRVLEVCMNHDIHAANDISGLTSQRYTHLAADADLPLILMASLIKPGDAIGFDETLSALTGIVERCTAAGLDNYILDPGIGLWTPERDVEADWELCRHFENFSCFNRPLLAAVSRKSFIGHLLMNRVEERLIGSLGVTAILLERGASIVRTHDIAPTREVITICQKMRERR